jgi:hypothetical protein
VAWTVEVSDEFAEWYRELTDDEHESVNFSVDLLEELGPTLGRPHVDTVRDSRHANMKELRVQHQGRPYRILFAFDPRRAAYLYSGRRQDGRCEVVQGQHQEGRRNLRCAFARD